MALTQVPLNMLDPSSGGLAFRNKLINGNFDFWQRGTANGSTDSAGYLADRWKRLATGTTLSQSRQAFTLGQTSVPGEPQYYWEGAVTSSAGSGNYALLAQYVEGVRTLAGQTAVVTFYAKADASRNIALEFNQSFGTGGSPSSAVLGIGVTTCALTTSWQKFTVPVTLPSISGKTLGSNGDDFLGMIFWFDAGSTFNSRTNSLGQQSGTFSIARVQLEKGSAASDFEVRPPQAELALCQRYCYAITGTYYARKPIFGNTANGAIWYPQYPVPMRVPPTTFSAVNVTGSTLEAYNYNASANTGGITNAALAEGDNLSGQVSLTFASVIAAAQVASWRWVGTPASAFIFSAEL